MPVDNHPEYKGKSAAEVIMTVLHVGGKFGGEGYKISGGLHGVGASVVNALSSRLDVEIHRDGGKWVQHFAKGGKPQDKLTKVGSSKKHGTIVTFWPDESIFEETDFARPDPDRAPARDGVPQQGARDPVPSTSTSSRSWPRTSSTTAASATSSSISNAVEGALSSG